MEPFTAAGYNCGMKPHKFKISRAFAAGAAAATLCTLLLAQPSPTPTLTPNQPQANNADGSLSHADRAFMKKAAKAGNKEVAVSGAVIDKLSTPQLKSFAQTMITDHTAAGAELATLAASKNVQLPQADPSVADDWSKMTGDMDRKYIKEMVSDHEEAVRLFEKGAQSSDADVAAFAQKTLPTLQHHLMMAQDLAKASY
jgi:putative membrane protein